MLILLPPSETKSDGGDGPRLELERLSFPELNPARKELVDELVGLAADVPASRAALGLSERQDDEIARNAALWSAPTAAALHLSHPAGSAGLSHLAGCRPPGLSDLAGSRPPGRYTGVLYDALDAGSLQGAAAARAAERLVVCSALFGLLRAGDPVPAYRLSGGSALPGRGTLAAFWRPLLDPVLAELTGLVVDLRSGSYAALGRIPGGVAVRVLTECRDGSRSVVSHHNKATKGRVARLLAGGRAEPTDVAGLQRVLRRAGWRVEQSDPPHRLDVVLVR